MGATRTWNLDQSRHARESLHPADYLTSSYYAIWTKALEKQVLANGLVSAEELKRGHALSAPVPVRRVLHADKVAAGLRRGGPAGRPAEVPARFALGDSVVTRTINPSGHTRLPRYARGKRGVIEAVRGVFVFPDTNAPARRMSAVALHSCFLRSGAVGTRGGSVGRGVDRCLGELP